MTLTTDFGVSDHYVGVVKGVILSENPQARIVDVCHQVEPYDVLGAALTLAAAYPWFPPGTVHVAVVDPGVGTARRAIAAAAGGWLFVAPDNGVLELVYQRHRPRVWALRVDEFARRPISRTFHGRDVFAPAAGLLSRGTDPAGLGEPVRDFARLNVPRLRRRNNGTLRGVVLRVDRFGNLITNLPAGELPASFRMQVGETEIQTLRPSYAAAAPGEIFAIAGSAGYIEISRRKASAADAIGVGAGATVDLWMNEISTRSRKRPSRRH